MVPMRSILSQSALSDVKGVVCTTNTTIFMYSSSESKLWNYAYASPSSARRTKKFTVSVNIVYLLLAWYSLVYNLF